MSTYTVNTRSSPGKLDIFGLFDEAKAEFQILYLSGFVGFRSSWIKRRDLGHDCVCTLHISVHTCGLYSTKYFYRESTEASQNFSQPGCQGAR